MRRYHAFPTREKLHSMFTYDEHLRGLYWREWKNGRKKSLDAACMSHDVRMVKIDGVLFRETDLIRIYTEAPCEDPSAPSDLP